MMPSAQIQHAAVSDDRPFKLVSGGDRLNLLPVLIGDAIMDDKEAKLAVFAV